MTKVANKLQKSIKTEKEMVKDKPLAVTNDEEQFNRADQFFAERENKYSQHMSIPELKIPKQPLKTSTFSLPEDEYEIITDTLKLFAKNDKFIKQTEVFRIALAAMKKLSESEILEIYSFLPKVSGRK